jgi:hypothetical protein
VPKLLRSLAKSVVPSAWVDGARAVHRDRRLSRALRVLRDAGELSPEGLVELHTAWGNSGFSCDVRFLGEVQRRLGTATGTVLECGTGATTILAGVLAERHGFRVVSLEQDPAWATHVRHTLDREHLARVTVVEAPLRLIGDHAWYALDRAQLPDDVSLVICDGPFVAREWGESVHSAWRYGVVPQLLDGREAEMLLDDFDDPRAPGILDRWSRDFGATWSTVDDENGAFAVVSLRSPPHGLQ